MGLKNVLGDRLSPINIFLTSESTKTIYKTHFALINFVNKPKYCKPRNLIHVSYPDYHQEPLYKERLSPQKLFMPHYGASKISGRPHIYDGDFCKNS